VISTKLRSFRCRVSYRNLLQQKESLTSSKKLEWHNEELEFISSKFFSPISNEDISIRLNKSEERNLLKRFNETVIQISEQEHINQTLFFSKKSQRDLLRIALNDGLEVALESITLWRGQLIARFLEDLLLDY